MAEWTGKSRGTVFGFKVFVFFIKNFGIKAAYWLTALPIPYFVFFAPNATKSSFYFLNKRLQFSKTKAGIGVLKTYYAFGQVLIDRLAINLNQKKKYSFELDGVKHIENLLAQKSGGFLFTAHIGNFNLANNFFENLTPKAKVNMLMTDNEHEQIKEYISSIAENNRLNIIVVKKDFSHIFKIKEALSNNQLIVIAADRDGKGKNIPMQFLSKTTQVLEGPYKLASLIKRPILFVHIMRESNYHYHLYARPFRGKDYRITTILEHYFKDLEEKVKRYPYQWFNFYDYWKVFKK